MPGERPVIHLTNHASRKPPHRGPGRVWTMMARPRAWEHGEGRVPDCTPSAEDLDAVRSGRIVMDEYRARFLSFVLRLQMSGELQPGRLQAIAGDEAVEVGDGDTLCCACSRAAAAKGECHRAWLAPVLARSGWTVVLDGEVLDAP